MRKLYLILSIFVSACMSFAQETPNWTDSHELINNEIAAKYHIDDKQQLISMSVTKFKWMCSVGLVNWNRCKIFHITSYVDFCDYLLGYWDTEYSIETPGSEKGERELLADTKSEKIWNDLLQAMSLHEEMSKNARYDKDSGVRMIREYLRELMNFDIVHDNSPAIRLLLPERINLVEKYLKN